MKDRIAFININIAQAHFLRNEYETARTLLEEVVTSEAGRENLEGRITLARVYARLGDFENANRLLERTLADMEASGQMEFAADAHAASGELAYESGTLQEARRHFDKAASLWTEDLPHAASVEARCYEGLLDTLTARNPAARRMVELGAEQARKMGRLYLEARCRVALARILFSERRYLQAVAALDEIPRDGDRTIGPELQAEVHYWRGRAMEAGGDRSGAASETALARKLTQKLRAALPQQYRDGFASRSDIRPLVE